MAKQTGMGAGLFVGGYDLSGDAGSLDRMSGGPNPLVVTGINKSAIERIGGIRTGGLDFSSFWNSSAGQMLPALSPLTTADRVAVARLGSSIGDPACGITCKQVNFDPTRGADGSLVTKISLVSNGFGVEWGQLLTAGLRTDTAATNGASLDNTASSAFGLQAYLQVTAFVGVNLVVKLQDSPDNAAWSDVTGGAFTQITSAPTAERIATASGQSIARYLRVVTTSAGGFTSGSFLVTVARNATSVVF